MSTIAEILATPILICVAKRLYGKKGVDSVKEEAVRQQEEADVVQQVKSPEVSR